MWATSDGPRVEDFGITDDDLARAPRPFVSSHRVGILSGAYLIAAVVVFCLIFQTGDSWAAAAFFTLIMLAAGSVLLLPAVMLVLCVGERAEERWLCRRIPVLRACLAYRGALAEHRRNVDNRAPAPTAPEDWPTISTTACIALLRSELDRHGGASVIEVDRETTGCDFIVNTAGRCLLLRCESGVDPVGASVGRELAASLSDHKADAAVIVTAAEPTNSLRSYISGRQITIATPWDVTTQILDNEC